MSYLVCPRCNSCNFSQKTELLMSFSSRDYANIQECVKCNYKIMYGFRSDMSWWMSEIFNIDEYLITIYHHHNWTWVRNEFTGFDLSLKFKLDSFTITEDKLKIYNLFS